MGQGLCRTADVVRTATPPTVNLNNNFRTLSDSFARIEQAQTPGQRFTPAQSGVQQSIRNVATSARLVSSRLSEYNQEISRLTQGGANPLEDIAQNRDLRDSLDSIVQDIRDTSTEVENVTQDARNISATISDLRNAGGSRADTATLANLQAVSLELSTSISTLTTLRNNLLRDVQTAQNRVAQIANDNSAIRTPPRIILANPPAPGGAPDTVPSRELARDDTPVRSNLATEARRADSGLDVLPEGSTSSAAPTSQPTPQPSSTLTQAPTTPPSAGNGTDSVSVAQPLTAEEAAADTTSTRADDVVIEYEPLSTGVVHTPGNQQVDVDIPIVHADSEDSGLVGIPVQSIAIIERTDTNDTEVSVVSTLSVDVAGHSRVDSHNLPAAVVETAEEDNQATESSDEGQDRRPRTL